MKVYISYGDAADQVTALRLQALGAANGLTVYVPPAHTRRDQASLDPEAGQKLNDAEVVLGVIGEGLSEVCRQELNIGLELHKHMIVMAYPLLAQQLSPYLEHYIVVIDPDSPDQSERAIVHHLRQISAEPAAKKALLALGTLVLGLLILAPAGKT